MYLARGILSKVTPDGVDSEPPAEIKKIFKEAMYSLCFGKGKSNLTEFLRDQGMPGLLKHPILRELFQLRRQWFRRIEGEGGARDVWGQWHALDESRDPRTGKSKRWAGSIGATVIQSIEMEIFAPIFDVALRHGKSDQFGICLFQHDGATLSFTAKEKIPRAQAKLKAADRGAMPSKAGCLDHPGVHAAMTEQDEHEGPARAANGLKPT